MEVLIDLDKLNVRTLERIAKDYKFNSDKEIGTLSYYEDFIEHLRDYTMKIFNVIAKDKGV